MSSQDFISSKDLTGELGDDKLGVVDSSWYMPDDGRSGAIEFLNEHVPGAVFFNIDEICDHKSQYPHMLPDEKTFGQAMTALGLGDGMRFVVYDTAGLFASPRAWWTMKAFGVKDVRILTGGKPQWLKDGGKTETGEVNPTPKTFTPKFDPAYVATTDSVKAALASGSAQVLDARPAARFTGQKPEPRKGVRPGHVPGSINVPYTELLAGDRLKDADALKTVFANHKVDLNKAAITMCGSGVTAAILALALNEAGGKFAGLYDGSYAEWGSRPDCPVVTGSN